MRTKQAIIKDLYDKGHITFEEMYTLIQDNQVPTLEHYYPTPVYPSYPLPWSPPFYYQVNTTCHAKI